jgi:phage baseplate assembly protein W
MMTETPPALDRPIRRNGIVWPMSIDSTGSIATTGLFDDLSTPIWIILSTRPGERLMFPEFGCRLPDGLTVIDTAKLAEAQLAYNDAVRQGSDPDLAIVRAESLVGFGPLDSEQLTAATNAIRDAVTRWEPRSQVDDVLVEAAIHAEESAGHFNLCARVDIRIHYADRATKRSHTAEYATEFRVHEPLVVTHLTRSSDRDPDNVWRTALFGRTDRRSDAQ